MNGVYEVTLSGAARFPDDPPPVEWSLHVSTAKLPRAADGWDAPNGVAVPVPVGDVVTLPENEDQSAVTVRMCYPRPVVSGSAGDTSNSGEKADTASGFVTGSCPHQPSTRRSPICS